MSIAESRKIVPDEGGLDLVGPLKILRAYANLKLEDWTLDKRFEELCNLSDYLDATSQYFGILKLAESLPKEWMDD